MKELTVVYKWENGQEGTFVHPSFPEVLDMASACINPEGFNDPAQADAAVEALEESSVFRSLYWGWFRQVLVTWRAEAKRYREGNKSTAPLSAEDTAKVMAAKKPPAYDTPSEHKDIVSKVAETFTPAQIAELLAKLGITRS
jgi:hypothetical protein